MAEKENSNSWDKKRLIIESIVAIACVILGNFWGQSSNTYYFNGIKIEEEELNAIMEDNAKYKSENDALETDKVNLQEEVEDLNQKYENLESQNKELSNKYDTLADQSNKKIEDLNNQLKNMPIVDYKNLALCIDVDDIPINTSKSVATIDGRDYFSKEIVEKLITENRNLTVKDETIYIGQVVAEKANLLDMNVMDSSGVEFMTTVKDSYNKNRSNAICITTGNSVTKHIIFTLDNKYSLLKLSIGIRDNAKITSTGVLVIKADNDVVYTSDTLNKETEPYTTPEIPINNCNRLTIEYTPNPYSIDCIIYNAIVYN